MRRAVVSAVLALAVFFVSLPAFALGRRVLLYSAGSSITLGYGGLAAEMKNAGASAVDTTWPASLADHRTVFLLDVNALAADKLNALKAFIADGGGVVIVGEPLGNGSVPVNDIAKALGVTPRAQAGYAFDQCNEVPNVGTSPLTQGAASLSVSRGHVIAGGSPLYAAGGNAAAAADGQVVVAGDSNSFADNGCLGCCSTSASTKTFWQNLYTKLPQPKSTGSDGGIGGDAGAGDDAGTDPDAGGGGSGNGGTGSGGGCAVRSGDVGVGNAGSLAVALLFVVALARLKHARRR